MALKRQYAIRVVYLSNIVIAVSYCGGRYQKYVEENVIFFKNYAVCCSARILPSSFQGKCSTTNHQSTRTEFREKVLLRAKTQFLSIYFFPASNCWLVLVLKAVLRIYNKYANFHWPHCLVTCGHCSGSISFWSNKTYLSNTICNKYYAN